MLGRFTLAASIVLGVILIFAFGAVQTALERAERAMAETRVARTRALLDRLGRTARERVEEYAFWDATVSLIEHPGRAGAAAFFQSNFVEWFPRYGDDQIELLDGKGGSVFRWQQGPLVDRSVTLTSRAILDRVRAARSVGGFFRENGALYLMGGALVLPSDAARHREPGRGFLLIGQRVRPALLARLREELQLELQFLAPDVPLTEGGGAANTEQFASGDSVRTRFRYAGLGGVPTMTVEVRARRAAFRSLERVGAFSFLITLLVGLSLLLVVWRWAHRLMLEPLSALQRELVAVRSSGGLQPLASAPPSAEWRLFLESFNATIRSLEATQARYRTIFDRSADALFILDAETGEVTDANSAATTLTGLSVDALVGEPLPAFLRQRTATGSTLRVRRPDGTVQLWGIATSTVEVGGCTMLVTAFRDLTDQEALAQAQKMEAVSELAGGIAHDFNNLVSSILASAAVLRRTSETGPVQEAALQAIEHAGLRAADLTRQLVSFSRHEPPVRVPVDLAVSVYNIERMCATTFDRRIRIKSSAPRGLPAVSADPGQVEQVLLNLCLNARDAMPSGGTLRLEVYEQTVDETAALRLRDVLPGRFVVVSVTDDGEGMTEEVKARLFEPFFTTKTRGRGTGLGLAMVYGLMRSWGGSIVVTSAPAEGTRFDLYFPATSGRPTPSSTETIPPPSRPERPRLLVGTPPTTGAHILLADDEDDLREMMRLVLEAEGFQVTEATTGEEALALAEESAYAAVVLDLQMPGMGGQAAAQLLRARRPELPLILCSGWVGDADEPVLRELRALGQLLTKPVDPRALVAQLQRLTAPP